MKIFQCDNCHHPVFFENTHCENCGMTLGFSPKDRNLYALEQTPEGWSLPKNNPSSYVFCSNHQHNACNWLVEAQAAQPFCIACQLNSVIPNLTKPGNLELWQSLEQAKHRLIYSLLRLELPVISKQVSAELGLQFQFLDEALVAPSEGAVMTGHDCGLITINLEEADPAKREQTRRQMGEHYRTLVGHFRHEVGHYYWDVLVARDEQELLAFRELFGDERLDYGEALKTHYQQSDDGSWRSQYVSFYAASHPWEDWAETWAHYFHLVDVLETAYSFGISAAPRELHSDNLDFKADFDPYLTGSLETILDKSVNLTFAVNSLNRSMGQPDLYPFVIAQPVKDKLHFIDRLINKNRGSNPLH